MLHKKTKNKHKKTRKTIKKQNQKKQTTANVLHIWIVPIQVDYNTIGSSRWIMSDWARVCCRHVPATMLGWQQTHHSLVEVTSCERSRQLSLWSRNCQPQKWRRRHNWNYYFCGGHTVGIITLSSRVPSLSTFFLLLESTRLARTSFPQSHWDCKKKTNNKQNKTQNNTTTKKQKKQRK